MQDPTNTYHPEHVATETPVNPNWRGVTDAVPTVLDFDPATSPEWELVGHQRGVPVYSPVDPGGCGGCDNGECCGLDRDDDLAGTCCGQGDYGVCPESE